MSTPPPGGWPPGPPPNPGQPDGQQGFNPQQPPGWQQGQWPQQPSPPPQTGSGLKWLLIAVAVLLVVAISVGATLIFTRDSGGSVGTTPSSAPASDFASAGDAGPVKVISDEPTCQTFNGINNALADIQNNGWGAERATLGPASEWTNDQRLRVEAVAGSMRNAADQIIPLAKKTPNRVVRELYQQIVAYGRAYSQSINSYTPSDDGFASVFVNGTSAIIGICNSIDFGSASRSLALKRPAQPTQVAPLGDPADPKRFVTLANTACVNWRDRLDRFNAESSPEWQDRDSSIPASQWSPARHAVEEAARPQLAAYADDMTNLAMQSDNAVFEDFATTASIYVQAFLASGDSYVSADGWLSYSAFRLANLLSGACRAAAE